jgi:hypothetical protein
MIMNSAGATDGRVKRTEQAKGGNEVEHGKMSKEPDSSKMESACRMCESKVL